MVTKEYIEQLIKKNELWRFYKSGEWVALKERILQEHHYECYECKKRGIITRYDITEGGSKKLISTVHHVQFVRTHPELALSEYYYYQGERRRNLIPVCKSCHNKLHPEKRKRQQASGYVNEERW